MTKSGNDRVEDQESERWRQTLEALEDVSAGQVIDGDVVHAWLRTWGTADELTLAAFVADRKGSALDHRE